jgi:histidine ammonia-lyase
MRLVTIDGNNLTLDQVVSVSRDNAKVVIDPRALSATKRGREALERLLEKEDRIYGVNTGGGALATEKISKEDLKGLQANLIRSHAASVGESEPPDIVRAMMLLRANTLLKGHSGIRAEIPELIVDLLNKQVHPSIPEKGSVGASGDLSPLSHMTLVLMGEGKAAVRGRVINGKAALRAAGQTPVQLEAKEGLALNNGTQQMLAIGGLALHDAFELLLVAEAALSLSLEALRGWSDAFDPRIQQLRPHPGQAVVAAAVRRMVEGSNLVRTVIAKHLENGRPQDPYSFRCAPQVMGAVADTIGYVKKILEVEMNSATDNPLVFPEDAVCLSGGNFHGQPISMAMDFLSLAVSNLANLSERRVAALLDPSLNNGLPAFLVGKGSRPGLSSGFMAVQYTATALVAENKVLTHPASSDSIPTSSNFEDFVSMGPGSAQKAAKIIENSQYVLAIELLAAAQGIDLRAKARPGRGTRKVYAAIRQKVSQVTEDRSNSEDIEKVRAMVVDGQLPGLVEKELLEND